ncbi:unnamed protein product [Pleuronectes platessa]|uniref:Uncharacterized protein n=1 Tax=Pleuronectes platessa TaxID=8262 RepID=A0A9N7V8W0_PLEPL|nr:unnamed protein product [Pleuronectes platessa]
MSKLRRLGMGAAAEVVVANEQERKAKRERKMEMKNTGGKARCEQEGNLHTNGKARQTTEERGQHDQKTQTKNVGMETGTRHKRRDKERLTGQKGDYRNLIGHRAAHRAAREGGAAGLERRCLARRPSQASFSYTITVGSTGGEKKKTHLCQLSLPASVSPARTVDTRQVEWIHAVETEPPRSLSRNPDPPAQATFSPPLTVRFLDVSYQRSLRLLFLAERSGT